MIEEWTEAIEETEETGAETSVIAVGINGVSKSAKGVVFVLSPVFLWIIKIR